MEDFTIRPCELSLEDIRQIKEIISKDGKSLKDVLINQYPDKTATIRYVKDKLGVSYDYDGIDFWESQAVIHNNQDPRGHTMEFCMYYRLTEKSLTFKEISLLREFEQSKIFRHLEEIIADIKFDDVKEKFSQGSMKKTSVDHNIKPPVSMDEYKESLKNLSRQKIIDGLVKAGIPYDEAVEFADETDKDRKKFNL